MGIISQRLSVSFLWSRQSHQENSLSLKRYPYHLLLKFANIVVLLFWHCKISTVWAHNQHFHQFSRNNRHFLDMGQNMIPKRWLNYFFFFIYTLFKKNCYFCKKLGKMKTKTTILFAWMLLLFSANPVSMTAQDDHSSRVVRGNNKGSEDNSNNPYI